MKLTENLGLKIAAVFLIFFASISFAVGAVGSVYANEAGLFGVDISIPFYKSAVYDEYINAAAHNIIASYLWESDFASEVTQGISYPEYSSNVRFVLNDPAAKMSLTNSPATDWDKDIEPDSFRELYFYVPAFDENGQPINIVAAESLEAAELRGMPFTLRIAVPFTLQPYGLHLQKNLYEGVAPHANKLLASAALSALVIAVATVYLCCAAGHVRDREGITLNVIDKIPYDLYFVVMGTAVFFGTPLLFMLAEIAINESNIRNYCVIGFLLLFGVLSLCLLSAILTTVSRIKLGGLLKNTLCYKMAHLIWRWTKGFFGFIGRTFGLLALEWRVFIMVAGFLWASFFCAVIAGGVGSGGLIMLVFALYGVVVYACCSVSKWFKQIVKGGHAIAEGDVDYKINSLPMRGEMRGLAEDLNSIAGGLGKAVEQRIKSERLKTELITNVSHDIKTPLTSIINYVDLLKKEPLEGKAVEYADILEKHANRLKKLTLDLIEASKAATGNITPELVPVNLCELVNQAVGEYSEKLEEGNIAPVVDMPEEARYIMADGKLFWRVIDNLLSNAAKYSQPGTRLYISVTDRAGQVVLDMKNISRERLNIAPEELTERFVRGDSSRHTEGSGLGLNIAKSLTELQKGTFAIEIDGDLFKAEVAFDRIFISSTEGEAD